MGTPEPSIVCLQMDIAWENKPANFQRVRQLLQAAQPATGSLVLLPEMFATGFSMKVSDTAEPAGGETEQFLAQVAGEFQISIVAGITQAGTDGRPRNQAVVIAPSGEEVTRYTKIHPFSPAGEAEVFVAGEELAWFEWNGWRVAPFVCYDLRFPELFRSVAREGAELLVVIANWPASRIAHWRTLLQARAIENQACVAAVNRCGRDPHQTYSGNSLVVNAQGEIVVEAGELEGIVQAQLDRESLLAWRTRFPALRDMRNSYEFTGKGS